MKAVYFMSGCPPISSQFRCAYQAEQLALLGATADHGTYRHPRPGLLSLLDDYACLVLHRVQYEPEIAELIDEAHARGRLVFFDSDDFVFAPEAETSISFFGDIDPSEADALRGSLIRHQQTLQACDGVIVSTATLARLASGLHRRTVVVPNTVGRDRVGRSEAVLAQSAIQKREGALTIGYLSGSPSHNRDFLEAGDALLWAFARFPEVRLRIVGPLQLDSRFDAFADRIDRLPMQPVEHLPDIVSGFDINLAPLEADNIFADSKSCIKYLEAALVAVPTVASRRSDFSRVIQSGVNGLLADSPAEWRDALRRLVDSPEDRVAMGRGAYTDVHAHHTTLAAAPRTYAAIEGLVRQCAPSLAQEPLIVNVVLDPAKTGHIPQVVGEFLSELRRRGHTVRHYVVADHEAAQLAPADVAIATSPRTAEIVAAHQQSLFKAWISDMDGEHCQQAWSTLALRRISLDEADDLEPLLVSTCFIRLARLDPRAVA